MGAELAVSGEEVGEDVDVSDAGCGSVGMVSGCVGK